MNNSLTEAKRKKNDEYYTKYEDVENELKHYKDYFKNKVIYLPCDSKESNFYKWFINNEKELQYKSLVSTCYEDGFDFREVNNSFADIIITNPPYSLWREFFSWCKNKSFIILGSINAITYKEVFPLLKSGELNLGYNEVKKFILPDGTEKNVTSKWFTNLNVDPSSKRTLMLTKKYDPEIYKKFDNYDAINVDKIKDIPYDYDGYMGVPITILDYNLNEYEIEWIASGHSNTSLSDEEKELLKYKDIKSNYGTTGYGIMDGKQKYFRILVKKNFEIVGLANSARYIGDYELYTKVDGKKIYNRVIIRRKND